MPDSSAIDNALVAKLGADSTLLALMPNNVHIDVPSVPNALRFVIVSLVDESDEQSFDGRAFEDALYMVKAVGFSKTSPNMQAAAARIDELLDGGTLVVPGYTLMTMHRESRIRVTERDEADPAVFWYHRGGNYRVVMST